MGVTSPPVPQEQRLGQNTKVEIGLKNCEAHFFTKTAYRPNHIVNVQENIYTEEFHQQFCEAALLKYRLTKFNYTIMACLLMIRMKDC